MTYLINF